MRIQEPDSEPEPISTPEDRERLLAETLAHVAAQEALYGRPLPESIRIGRWKGMLSLIVFMLAGYLALDPPRWLLGPEPEGVPTQHRVRGAASVLWLQAEAIEAFRLQHGRLPRGFDELDVRLSDIRFVRSNNRLYQLVTSSPAGVLVYDSARPSALFRVVTEGWIADSSPPTP